MAKLVLALFTSIDGYIEKPGGVFAGPAWSDDVERHWSARSLAEAGHLLYGRVNFEFNKAFWSPAATDPGSPAAAIPHARVMNALPKTVVSSTLAGDPGWNGRIAGPDLAAEVERLKQSVVDGDVYCFGGAGIATSLFRLGLVDELRLMVTPMLFGSGKPLFVDGRPAADAELLEALPLDTGSVILHWRIGRPSSS
jgi:dihydrofolate reductase